MSNAELSIPVIYGHNHDCLDICRDKIIRLRNGATFTSIIDNSVEDIYLPRSRSGFERDLANIRDIANTCKNYLKACCLVYEDNSSGEQRIMFNDDVSELYESAVQRKETFITESTEESFQRAYGAWNKRKDTRRLVNEDAVNLNDAKAGIILSSFYSLCGHNIITELPNDFIDTMVIGYGFSKNEIVEVIEPHLNSAIDYYESTFLDSARGGVKTALTFEKSLKDLMDKKFNFFAKHTGQILRNGVGGYADVFIVADDYNNCAILDAKASPSYAISSEDYSKLVSNYIPHYKELIDKFDELRGRDISLEFCSYVAGGFSGNIAYKLREASRATGVPCSAIRARDLLNLAKSGTAQLDIRNGMKNIKLLGVEDF